jgi:steroid 5-alpha reductase family enzyme
MKTPHKILLTTVIIALSIALLIALSFGIESFMIAYGLVAMVGGLISLLVGLLLLLVKNKPHAQGLLLSAAFLLLTGFLSCSLTF